LWRFFLSWNHKIVVSLQSSINFPEKEYKNHPVYQAMKMLPDWMVDVSERFDKIVNGEEY